MKYAITFFTLLVFQVGHSQTQPEDLVQATIETLFKGMKLGDSALVHQTFSASPSFVSMGRDKQGKPFIRNEELKSFLKAVGTPHAEVWNEEIWGLKISVDGDFAQAWCDYAFYVSDTFSHCGVDAFHLHNDGTSWKIFHLADTRRTEPCKIPATIQSKHAKK